MTFGDDPFGLDKKKDKKGIKPLTFFIIYLIMWYIFSHHFF
jgi:hypothetical protein